MGANGEMEGSSIVLATYKGAQIKVGDTDTQNLVVDAAGKGLADQTLNFKAWVQGDATTTNIDTGEFSSVVNFVYRYFPLSGTDI